MSTTDPTQARALLTQEQATRTQERARELGNDAAALPRREQAARELLTALRSLITENTANTVEGDDDNLVVKISIGGSDFSTAYVRRNTDRIEVGALPDGPRTRASVKYDGALDRFTSQNPKQPDALALLVEMIFQLTAKKK